MSVVSPIFAERSATNFSYGTKHTVNVRFDAVERARFTLAKLARWCSSAARSARRSLR